MRTPRDDVSVCLMKALSTDKELDESLVATPRVSVVATIENDDAQERLDVDAVIVQTATRRVETNDAQRKQQTTRLRM